MAREQPQAATRGLELKKAGNTIVTTVGGREIHPVNVRVGGFYRVPKRVELINKLHQPLQRARDHALATAHWTSTFTIPELDRKPAEYIALNEPDRYPIDLGRIVSNHRLDIPPRNSTPTSPRTRSRTPTRCTPTSANEAVTSQDHSPGTTHPQTTSGHSRKPPPTTPDSAASATTPSKA